MVAGTRFRQAIDDVAPLPVVGTVNAYAARLAETAGHRAVYLSGAGVANASYGLPDLGMTALPEVLEDVRRITATTDLPLLVDLDTGFGGAFNIARSIREVIKAGAAGAHIEDQVAQKRCGHRPNKAIVSVAEMLDRIKAAVDAKTDSDFVVMARTDALAVSGLSAVLERVQAFEEAGADAIFAEAMTDIDHYRQVVSRVNIPVLANITEFGQTPLYSLQELAAAGVSMVLYPLSAFRAMNRAALRVYETILRDGSQNALLDEMQTREELYSILGYHEYERKLDELFLTSE